MYGVGTLENILKKRFIEEKCHLLKKAYLLKWEGVKYAGGGRPFCSVLKSKKENLKLLYMDWDSVFLSFKMKQLSANLEKLKAVFDFSDLD